MTKAGGEMRGKENTKGNKDWDLLFNSASSLDVATDAITSYVKFCVDMIIPRITFKMFPNNKHGLQKNFGTC